MKMILPYDVFLFSGHIFQVPFVGTGTPVQLHLGADEVVLANHHSV